jgi:hypothetical protein
MNSFKLIKNDNLDAFQKECNELLRFNYKLYGYPKIIFDQNTQKMIHYQAFIMKNDNYSWKDWE